MPHGSEIVSAMDADAEGAKLADVVRKAVELSGRDDLRFIIQEPFGLRTGTISFVQQCTGQPCPRGPPKEPSVA